MKHCRECWFYVPGELGLDDSGKPVDLCVTSDIPIDPEKHDDCKRRLVMGSDPMPHRMVNYWIVRGLNEFRKDGMVLAVLEDIKPAERKKYG